MAIIFSVLNRRLGIKFEIYADKNRF